MKKILIVTLALLLLVTLVACKKDKTEGEDSSFDMSVKTTELVYETGNDYADAFTYE